MFFRSKKILPLSNSTRKSLKVAGGVTAGITAYNWREELPHLKELVFMDPASISRYADTFRFQDFNIKKASKIHNLLRYKEPVDGETWPYEEAINFFIEHYQLENAEAIRKKIINLSHRSTPYSIKIRDCYLELKEIDEAVVYWEKLDRQPDAQFYFLVGNAYYQLGQYDKSVYYSELAIKRNTKRDNFYKINVDMEPVLLQLARCYMKEGSAKGLIKAQYYLLDAIKLQKENAERAVHFDGVMQNNLATAYYFHALLDKKSFPKLRLKAIEHFEKAIAIDPCEEYVTNLEIARTLTSNASFGHPEKYLSHNPHSPIYMLDPILAGLKDNRSVLKFIFNNDPYNEIAINALDQLKMKKAEEDERVKKNRG